MTKGKRGMQAQTAPEVMLKHVMMDALKKANNFEAKNIQEVCVGNVNQNGGGFTTTRMAQFLAGIPATTPTRVTNRQCSSGLQATAMVANQITANEIDIGMAGGVESMSLFNMQDVMDPSKIGEECFDKEEAQIAMVGMGNTSDNVAEKFGISRQK